MVLERLRSSIVVPVVVLDRAEDAVLTANALYAGGIDVMEITFRTEAAADSIAAVAQNCPDMLVGAGTVLSVEQCELAVKRGAKFIVLPGYDEEVVSWCVKRGVPVIPGCVTPAEIISALKHQLKVVKFFPANIYGGLNAIKNLAAVFSTVKFMPTGGVNEANVKEYFSAPFIHAVGGSWVCQRTDILEGNYEKITELCRRARSAVK